MVNVTPDRPRKILMTTDAIGGVWTYTLELCRGLSAHDIEVSVAVMGRRLNDRERAAARQIRLLKIWESDYKLEWMENAQEDLARAGRWLLDLESRERPDVVHLNGYVHGALSWHAPCLIVGHSCVYSWFEAVRRSPPDALWQDYKDAVTVGLRRADVVTAPSCAMLSALARHYGPFKGTHAIYNGRSPISPPAEKQPLILTVGRLWDEAKNIAVLEEVATKILSPICAAGATANPAGEAVHLRGIWLLGQLEPEQLAAWFSRAAVFVLPARYEPFGLAVLEAALAGCALVLGDIPSLREIWQDAALFVPPDDSKEIAFALSKLVHDPVRMNDLAMRARQRASEFTPERMTRGYMDLYGKLLAAHAERDGAHSGVRRAAGMNEPAQ